MRNGVTIRGQWMYPREAAVRPAALVRSSLLRLDSFDITAFDLDHANEAVEHAANRVPFKMTAIRP